MSYQRALTALGDPTRQEILDRLRGAELAVGEIAATLPVSRPAVSKHLAVLEGAGLVRHVRVGTRSLYSLDTRGLADLRRYLDGFWTDVLTSYADHTRADRAPSVAETQEAP